MDDQRIYRWTGACGLAAIALFFIEFPFYLVRAGFPGVTDPGKITDFTAAYGTNVMICVFFDFIILTLVMIFLAGFRHLIRQADKQCEWFGTLVFGVGLVYVTLTFVADAPGVRCYRRTHHSWQRRYHSRHVGKHVPDVRLRSSFSDGGADGPSRVRWRSKSRIACVERLGRLYLRPRVPRFRSFDVCWQPRSHAFLQSCGLGSRGHRIWLPPGSVDDHNRHSHGPLARTSCGAWGRYSIGERLLQYSPFRSYRTKTTSRFYLPTTHACRRSGFSTRVQTNRGPECLYQS